MFTCLSQVWMLQVWMLLNKKNLDLYIETAARESGRFCLLKLNAPYYKLATTPEECYRFVNKALIEDGYKVSNKVMGDLRACLNF